MRPHVAAIVLATSLSLSTLHVAPALAGGPITSGSSVTGSISGPSYSEVWTFTGTTGDRVVISAAPTGGTLTTQIRLSNPSSVEVVNTTANYTDYKLLASGTYTLTIQDIGLSHSGTYSLTFVNITAGPLTSGGDADGGPIASASVATGQINAISDLDAFTFTGTAGSRVLIGAVATSGVSFNTTLTLYPPGGGAPETYTYGGDRMDWQLGASGTYTVVVSDYSAAHTGGYSISYLNVTSGPLTSVSDSDGGAIGSAQVKSGGFQSTPDFDAYTFSGTAGNRILIATAPTGGTSTPQVSLYPPGGGAAVVATTSNRVDYQLTATGTYTIIMEDSGLNDMGTYDLSLLNLTAGPTTTPADTDGTTIIAGSVLTGQMNADVDMDAFTFTALAGDRVVIGALATGGTGFNTSINLYPPGGGAAEAYSYGGDQVDVRVQKSGIYTIEIEDYALTHTGTYSLSYINVTEGPATTLGSGHVLAGQFTSTPQFNLYQFTVSAGNRVILDAVPTGGAANPILTLYPPGGGVAVLTSGSHRVEYQAPTGGTYTLLVNDQGLNDTGTFDLTLLNVTAGPLTTGADPDGGAIVSATLKTGQINQDVDMDAFTFTGSQGDRVVIGCLATSGASFNTSMTLYPPGGGAAEALSYGGDRLDTQLLQSGTYTVVVEDYSNAHPGTYSLMMLDVTSGPITSATDTDGGTINSGEIHSGSFQTTPDFDVYRFTVSAGDRLIFDAVPTGGTANPLVYIYPPGGGGALVTSGNHRVEYQVLASGTYTMLLEDQGLNDNGSYDVTLLDVTSGPLTTGADPDGGPITSASVKSGQINQDVDMDAFTFTGAAGDEVVIGAVRTGAGLMNTNLTLYPPGGGAAEALSYGGDRLDDQLQLSGTYTVVVEDYSNTYSGTYSLSLLNITAGPLTSAGDPDGGALQPGDTKLGQFQTTPDFDGYRFAGAFGDTVTITTTPTSGTITPVLYIYPPSGAALAVTAGSPYAYVLPARAIYTLVLQDQTMLNTGSYSVHFQKTGGYTGVPGPGAVTALALSGAAPNPFRSTTDLGFALPSGGFVTLRLFDLRGRLVRRLAEGRYDAGRHDVRWDGRDARGGAAPSGIYWAELRAGDQVLRKKIVRVE